MLHEAGVQPVFPPAIALYLVKLECELPDDAGRSLSLWTCAELARTLKADGIVETISPQSVQRILEAHQLKPWRVHHWLSSKVPRDTIFRETVLELCDLYTRPLSPKGTRVVSRREDLPAASTTSISDTTSATRLRTSACRARVQAQGCAQSLRCVRYSIRRGLWNLSSTKAAGRIHRTTRGDRREDAGVDQPGASHLRQRQHSPW